MNEAEQPGQTLQSSPYLTTKDKQATRTSNLNKPGRMAVKGNGQVNKVWKEEGTGGHHKVKKNL